MVDGLVMLSVKIFLSNAADLDMNSISEEDQVMVMRAVETMCNQIIEFWNDIKQHYLLFRHEKILKEYRILLKCTFDSVCVEDGELSVQHFASLIDHAAITALECETECITAFSNALMNPTPDHALSGMVYIEFLEACVEVALDLVDTEGLGDDEKIKIVLDQLI